MNTKKVGFIGLGNMGFPMASNLLKAGYTVYGMDVNRESEERFAEIGGEIGFVSAPLPDDVNVIFTSLPTPQVVETVYLGSEGLIANGGAPLTLIDLSTVSPEMNKKVANAALEKGIQYLAAPVSGSVSGAEAASLSVMVGGNKETFNDARPYFEGIGKNIFHVGEDHGLGTIVKLINNLMAGIHTQAMAEALAIADAVKLDHDVVYDIVNVSSGQSGIFTRNYKNFIAENEYYKGAFTTALLFKDIKLANHVSNLYGAKLPLGESLVNYLEDNIDGYADKDMSSVYLMLTEQKGEPVK
ncbi:3-hydroxyisobutyrate dehydrogenase [Virgibacillus natechei]|uniref:3-hydroxyisobutyrate dehydrogenase n=1 Tax=Virgibacillus natechei TaxID=1216297 RepID=A0ABS4ILA2_9BACI|nr:NAD(P)-dependent oxidoreductase [Virgibacillus natechei]MBP1971740.1 3-hydroxyisobutyrate dehydrogenase [Virgibacillus natechei]UZD12344.1 NAD(P)-dependent oxidoreductase [Virgibacillus natechei]